MNLTHKLSLSLTSTGYAVLFNHTVCIMSGQHELNQ